MEHFHDWLNLLLRWIHFIVGIAWIGASFYFNWLENNLDRRACEHNTAGELWAIHGGGFYHLKKYQPAPSQLPTVLHWFKWEAYATWLSGVALLVTVYYVNARVFLLSPDNSLSAPSGIAIGVVTVIGAWFFYDALCRSPLRRSPVLLAATVFAGLVLLAWALSGVFSGRAAYLHIGAAIGTMMVGNVFFVIIPAQKKMVAALSSPSPASLPSSDVTVHGENALLRSRHNNYLTLPVLFMMVSVHFPFAYGHAWNWAVLAGVSVAGWLARHYFNIRHRSASAIMLLPAALVVLAALAWFTVTTKSVTVTDTVANTVTVTTANIMPIIHARCTGCHADSPTQTGFTAAPLGLTLQTAAAVERNAAQIYSATVITKTMPIANLTGMTVFEREKIAAWFHARK